MTPIETNKPLFFDTDGSPLEGGLIYIGQPSTDPRTNPKTVTFRDSGGSEFTASQPLKTKAGRIVYNGLPIVSLVEGEYSMLIINANGQQVDYSRSVNAEGETGGIADFSEVTRVGLTLAEIKTFDVSVGDTVRSVGKATAMDGLGADWLVVSNTGGTANDVDLIDFVNGLQGERYTVYPQHIEETVELGGNFSPGASVKCVRTGSAVTISSVGGLLTHASFSSPGSATGVIPEWARPTGGDYFNVAVSYGAGTTAIIVNPTGRLLAAHRDWSGALTARTDTFAGFSITYTV